MPDIYAGKRLKVRRTVLGISQATMGNKAGITFQQIQKYERGLNRISVSRLSQFCKILKVEPNYFFNLKGNDEPSEVDRQMLINNRYYLMLCKKDQDKISKIIQIFKKGN